LWFTIVALFTGEALAMEWTITIEGRNESGEVCRKQIQIDKSWERLRDGEIGLSIDDGKAIMKAVQSAVVNQEMETYGLFRRVCPDCHTFRPVKDYTKRRIRTIFGSVEVRNPRWMLCPDCHPGMVGGFTVLKEICPDRATPELMELTARLGSMLPYRQAASMLAEFLPIEPTETHATVRKRTIKIGGLLDDQLAKEAWRSPSEIADRCQLEMQLLAIAERSLSSVSTRLTFAAPTPTWHATLKSSLPDVAAVDAVIWVAAISSPATPISPRYGIAACKLFEARDTAVLGTTR
jgi:hypothetical protein